MPGLRQRWVLVPLAFGGLAVAVLAGDWWFALPEGQKATFVGRSSCIECHTDQAGAWKGSNHDRAMELATAETVLGDFDDRQLEHHGVTSRMFRRGEQFFVTTEGRTGKTETYLVKYTFGVRPLQQYLTQFPDGRVQVLPAAWDTEKRRWFHLYPDEEIAAGQWLHWTGGGQNWNYMCAECHSTNVEKNYNPQADTYHTTFSEIDVSCEACHGPGSMHVDLARSWSAFWDRRYGYGLVELKGADTKPEIDTCARCHSRRRTVYPGDRPGAEFLDHFAPELLDTEAYHPDGQIDDEVYEYGSFLQSKMFRKGVRCSDCHDPHSAQLRLPGNQLCGRCHTPGKYDTPAHHHHAAESSGASCVNCHMPTKHYMVVDPRRDHSLRIPRPDLTVKLGTPNACNDCHQHKQQTPQWAAEQVAKWYGDSQQREPHYGEAILAGRQGKPEAEAGLIKVLESNEVGPNVRASAVSLLGPMTTSRSRRAIRRALDDPEPLVRAAAVASLTRDEVRESAVPLLTDPIRLVRTEAARMLTQIPVDELSQRDAEAFESALQEYLAGQQAMLDSPAAHTNLGQVYFNRGELDRAADSFRRAVELVPEVIPPRRNLAMLYLQQGNREQAEKMWREIIAQEPESADDHFHLGLLLAEERERLPEAAQLLATAARLAPDNATMRYNHGLALQQLGHTAEAEAELLAAWQTDPGESRTALALVSLYVEADRLTEAVQILEQAARLHPARPDVIGALSTLYGRQQRWAEAEQMLLAAYRRNSSSVELVAGLTTFYVERKQWTQAERFAKELLQLRPSDPQLRVLWEHIQQEKKRGR